MPSDFIQICPKCKSTDISPDTTPQGRLESFVDSYICNNCGYSGSFFPEVDKKELEKITKKKK